MSKIKDFFIELFSFSKIGALFLFLLVSVDFVFIIIHCLNMYGIIGRNPLFFIGNEEGYSDVFQYIKEFWIFILLGVLFIKNRGFMIFIWLMFFLYILLDDSLTIHETLGEYLANYFEIKPRFNLRAVDFGELMVSFIAGITFLMFFILGYNKAKIKDKIVSQHLFVLFIILVFFGVFVDMIHIYFESNHKLGLIEDGGEMLTISLITSYVFNLTKSDSQI
jgi:hypothetical protein